MTQLTQLYYLCTKETGTLDLVFRKTLLLCKKKYD